MYLSIYAKVWLKQIFVFNLAWKYIIHKPLVSGAQRGAAPTRHPDKGNKTPELGGTRDLHPYLKS